jgi:hypothetical protein
MVVCIVLENGNPHWQGIHSSPFLSRMSFVDDLEIIKEYENVTLLTLLNMLSSSSSSAMTHTNIKSQYFFVCCS